jgi:acetyl-CoA carboxylase, biotin carboxylase subunit
MSGPRFTKVLVANRGEIAVRVLRACRELGLRSVAVYSDADRAALHVQLADEAYAIGPAPARDSYLRGERILEAAHKSGAQALHPGYGFLAENPAFARSCEAAGLVFIGPRSETIALLGEKTSARRLATEAGVPVVPGALVPLRDLAEIQGEALRIGFPVMLKAAAGGGGKGMRLVQRAEDLEGAAARARSEAHSAFGDDSLYLERALLQPHHIEVQVLADTHGNVVHLFERECSVQRRHQKVLEESPSPFLTPELRERMGRLAVELVRHAGYVNAGTVEFLVDQDRNPYFLEVNTRLQVEHPVTEMVTGVDLVKLQIAVAQGEALPFRQEDLVQRGHAIECRIYAEDPANGFLPSPGRIVGLRVPGGPGIRDDSGVYEGWEVPIHYDPLISKLVAWDTDRSSSIQRLRRALSEYKVLGIKTTLPFFERVLCDPNFVAGRYDLDLVVRLQASAPDGPARPWEAALVGAAIEHQRQRQKAAATSVSGPDATGSAWRRSAWRELGERWR